MATPMSDVSRALQHMGWLLIGREGLEIGTSCRVHLNGPPIGVDRLFSPASGFVADVGVYSLVLWHSRTGTPGRGRYQSLEAIHEVLKCRGEEELGKHLAKLGG